MNELTISNIGLILLIIPSLVHGIELLFPTQIRSIANYVLPLFGPRLPNPKEFLNANDQFNMMNALTNAVPEEKRQTVEDYLFILIFEQRQGALCFIAAAAGAIYGLTLGLSGRDALHFVFGIIAVFMALVNANQAGLIPFFGNHPRVSVNGKHVGLVFTPFWIIASILNYLGFTYALA